MQPKPSFKIGTKEIIFIVIAVAALIIALVKPIPNILPITTYTLSLFIFAIAAWALKPFRIPWTISALFFMAMLILIGVPYTTAASGFTASSFWILLAGLYYGFILNKTGLGKRIAFYVLKLFPPTYVGIVVGATVIVALFSLLTPSLVVRIAIVGPIVLGLIECANIPKRSSTSAGIILTTFVMNLTIGLGWFTGSLSGPITFGLAPDVAKPFILPSVWSSVYLVPALVFSAILLPTFILLFRPKQPIQCSKDFIKNEAAKLGKWSSTEKITMVILIGTLIGWISPTLGIANLDSGAVGMIGLFVMFLAQVMETKEIAMGMNWDLLIWIGVVLGFSGIFSYTKLSAWISGILGGVFYPLGGNLMILLLAIGAFLMLFRFVDVAVGIPTCAMFGALMPTFISMGINPAVIYWVIMIAGYNVFILPYTSMFLQATDAVTKGELLTQKDSIKAGVVYAILTIVMIVISAFYFQITGIAFI